MKPKRILVATRPELTPVINRAYDAADFVTILCLTLQEAVAALDGDIDLIACGAHFGNGELYDFLRLAKANPKSRDIPFLVLDSGKDELYSYLQQSVEIASKALGAMAVVPITTWRRERGDEAAFDAYRQLLRKILGEQQAHAAATSVVCDL